MNPADWQRVGQLFTAVLELPIAQRSDFLDRACAGDVGLRSEVELLVAADEAPGPLDGSLQVVPTAAPAAESIAMSASSPPRVVGHYRIGQRLGAGGMGIVYKAEDLKLQRTVALKFLPPELVRDEAAKERFLREARAASHLDHANICTVYEIGEDEGDELFIAMAFYDGETLKQKIERGPLPVDDAKRIVRDIARGLAKAHATGIVHRDIKPANVMVTAEGVVKIVDFGVAKLSGSPGVTLPGALLGTAAYMAPEQIRGGQVGPVADLFALGVIFHELLTGQQPFRSDSQHGVIYAILNEDPPALAVARPDAPPELEAILARLLQKDPGRRTPSAEELLSELAAVSDPSDVTTAGVGSAGPRTQRVHRTGSTATDAKLRQTVRYVRTGDGVQHAWAEAGAGPPLVKASNWLTHLEYEWDSPVWRHWMHFFAARHRFIRYDERGCGMTDREFGELSVDTWLGDLEAVVAAAKPESPVVLVGISQGAAAAVAFAARHPERVSHLVLYGGYAQGWARRGDEALERRYRAMIELVRYGWGSDNATFRQVFTSRFIPDGTDEQIRWFNELCIKTTSAENAARLLEARGSIDVTALLKDVRTPTLVIHSRDDNITPPAQSRLLASGIPDAEFVELDSRNHILLADEPAWRRFCDAVNEFTAPADR